MVPDDRGAVTDIECGECGKSLPGQVGACPHCGSFLRVDRGEGAAGDGRSGAWAAAVVIAVITLSVVGFGGLYWGYLRSISHGTRHGDIALLAVIGSLLLVGGLWSAWRVGKGRWGLRRRSAGPPPPV